MLSILTKTSQLAVIETLERISLRNARKLDAAPEGGMVELCALYCTKTYFPFAIAAKSHCISTDDYLMSKLLTLLTRVGMQDVRVTE